jgi:hypothetical protein
MFRVVSDLQHHLRGDIKSTFYANVLNIGEISFFDEERYGMATIFHPRITRISRINEKNTISLFWRELKDEQKCSLSFRVLRYFEWNPYSYNFGM